MYMELQQFINFLKRNNCYEQFIEDFKEYPTKWRLDRNLLNIEDIEKIFLMNERDIIWYSLTFYVKRTLSKYKVNFWNKIDRLWGNVIFVNTKYN